MRKKVTMEEFVSKWGLTKFHNVEKNLNSKYNFRRNIVNGRVEFKLIAEDENHFSELTDTVFNTLYCQIEKANIKFNLSNFNAILNSDFAEPYDPFQSYFESLSWDGQTDYITQLAETIDCTNNPLWKGYFKRWLVAVVACAAESIPNHTVLVLSGKQGVGKSTWLNKLLPNALKQYIYSGTLDPSSKDSLIHLGETMFINMDELDNLNKAEQGDLKSLISKDKIRVRRPYGRHSENINRRASFMGSINDLEFLTDTTGNRRFLCFTAIKIDFNHKIEMDLVYAQAYSLFKNGENGNPFKYYFDKDDMNEIEENNSNYKRISIEEDLINKYFTVPIDNANKLYLTPTDIIFQLVKFEKMQSSHQINFKKLGQVMHMLGFEKKSTKTSKPYAVVYSELATSKLHLLP